MKAMMVYPTLATVLEKQELQCYQLSATPPLQQNAKASNYAVSVASRSTNDSASHRTELCRCAEIIASVIDDIFNIVCILLLLIVIHRLIISDPKVKTVEVFNVIVPVWTCVTVVSVVGITVFIIAILTYTFFIIAAAQSSGEWIFICVFSVFPVMRITMSMASIIFIILLSSSSLQNWIGTTSTVMLLFIYAIIFLDVIFTLLFLFAIISEKSRLKGALTNLWTMRNIILLFANLFLILFYLNHDNNIIFTFLTIFSVFASFVYIWVLWDWKLRTKDCPNELPKCGTMVLKIAIKLMEEDSLWIHKSKDGEIDDLYETIAESKSKFKVTRLDTLPRA